MPTFQSLDFGITFGGSVHNLAAPFLHIKNMFRLYLQKYILKITY